MKVFFVGLLLLIGAVVDAPSQEVLGFSPSGVKGTTIKLDGFAMQQVQGGYLAVSVPPRDIERFLSLVMKLSPHMAILEVLEHVESETSKIAIIPSAPVAPFGICFLSTDEVFQSGTKCLKGLSSWLAPTPI